MLLNPKIRRLRVKRAAREFANKVKESQGYAFKLPDSFIDSHSDEEVNWFIEYLQFFGLKKRSDFLWEEDK